MATLKLDTRNVGDVTVIYPKGFIDAHTVKDFESLLVQAIEGGGHRIVINGRDLAYIASAGLGALMGVIEEVRSQRGDIRLSELTDSVYNVFDILGFTHLFQVYRSEEEALGSFAS